MEDMYAEIFKRKSVRSFTGELTEQDLAKVQAAFKKVKPLIPTIPFELSIGEKEARGDKTIQLYSQDKEPLSLLNAGYILEQLDLLLEGEGLGLCYLGMAKPTKEELASHKLTYVMMLDVGKCDPAGFRTKKEDFTRNYIEDVFEGDFNPEVKEAVRLAPSSVNGQPWKVVYQDDVIRVYRKRAPFNAIPDSVMSFFHFVDLGILICHLDVALDHFQIKYEQTVEVKKPVERLTEVLEAKILH